MHLEEVKKKKKRRLSRKFAIPCVSAWGQWCQGRRGEFRLIFCGTSKASVLTISGPLPAVTALLALGVSISILLCFIYFPLSKVAHSRHCRLPTERSFSVGSFVSLFITQHLPSSDPPRPLKTPSKAVGSVCPGGLFFIVIHPAGVPLYAQRRLSLWETNAFFKKWRRKSKATKFQSSFSVGIVVSDGEALLSSCCLCPCLNMLISWCGWGDCGEVLALCICYGKKKKKTSNFFSTWPAVCCIHKYGGGGASHGGNRLGWAWGNSQKHLQKISVSNAAP